MAKKIGRDDIEQNLPRRIVKSIYRVIIPPPRGRSDEKSVARKKAFEGEFLKLKNPPEAPFMKSIGSASGEMDTS